MHLLVIGRVRRRFSAPGRGTLELTENTLPPPAPARPRAREPDDDPLANRHAAVIKALVQRLKPKLVTNGRIGVFRGEQDACYFP